MKFKVFKKKEIVEKEVFFQVREGAAGGIDVVTVFPDGCVQYSLLNLSKKGIKLMEGIGSEIGLTLVDGLGKVVILDD